MTDSILIDVFVRNSLTFEFTQSKPFRRCKAFTRVLTSRINYGTYMYSDIFSVDELVSMFTEGRIVEYSAEVIRRTCS